MTITAPPTITALPTPPDPNDRATFNTRAYPWSVAQQTLADEVEAVASNVYNNATAAASAAVAADSAAVAADVAALTATNKAAEAANKAAEAAAHVSGLPAGTINDSLIDSLHTWSSEKVASAIADAVNDWPPVGAIVGLTSNFDTLTVDGREFLRAGLAVHPSTVPGWPEWATPPDSSFPTVSSGASSAIRATAFAGSSGVWMLAHSSSLRRSADHGATWASVTSGFTGTIRSLEYGNGVFIAAADAGVVRRSTDGGVTWGAVTSGFSASFSIGALATDGAGVWVAGNDNGDIRRSTDNGATWGAVTSGFSAGQSISGILFAGGVWLAIGVGGTRRSTDGGVTWSAVATGLSSASGAAIAADGAGVWVIGGDSGALKRSTDNGASFTSVSSGLTSSIRALATDGLGNWWAGGSPSGMKASGDNGLTWGDIAHGFVAEPVYSLRSYAGIVTIAAGGGSSTPILQRRRYAIGIDAATPNQYLRIA